MSDYNSATYTAQALAASRADKIGNDSVQNGGTSTPYTFQWTAPASTATGETVNMGFLPAGVTVSPGSTIHCSQSGTNAIDLGFDGAAQALAAAVPTAAGIALINPATTAYKNESRQVLLATLADTIDAGTVITITLAAQRGE